jgi:hypothetical protein
MKLRLSIILLAAALAAAPAAGQTIKSLGYNTTNGQVVYSGVNTLTFTNTPHFTNTIRLGVFGSGSDRGFVGRSPGGTFALYGTNVTTAQPSFYGFDGSANTAFSAGVARTNLGGTTVGNSVFTATNAAAAASAIGLGTSNSVLFGSVEVGGGDALYLDGAGIESGSFGGKIDFEEQRLTQDDLTVFSWATNSFSVTPAATFATNVTVNGNLSVGSLTTTTPSTWALDATETAAATNGILALPSNANVIRLTNNTAISGVSGGVLGAFYYLVNQTTNAVTISNVGGITVQGGTPLTLGANQAATLVATGATNASVAARGDLTDVTLGGTLNIAPSQTADSASSLMTRSLSDARFYPLASFWLPAEDMQSYNSAGAGNPTWTTTASIMNMVTPFGRSPRTVAAPDATGRSEGIYTIPAGWPAGAQVRVTTYLALFNSATTNVFNLVLGGYWTTNTNIISPVATAIGSVFGGSSTLTTNVAGTGTTNEYFKISNTFSFATNANVENRQVYVARFSTSTNDTATNTIYFIGSHVELLP